MTLFVITFVAFFSAAALVLYAVAGRKKDTEQAISRLESLTAPQGGPAEEELNLRRADELSTVPWLDRFLRKVRLAERLKLLLYQADLQWTVGRLLLIAAALGCVVGTLVNLRTGALLLSFVAGGGGRLRARSSMCIGCEANASTACGSISRKRWI